ncbi:unnamed protein product, partial [Rotaria sp. Silwood1]
MISLFLDILVFHSYLDETLLFHIFKNQILSLVIHVNQNGYRSDKEEMNTFIFTHIITMFINLKYLNFAPSSISYQELSFYYSPPHIFSSNLLELHVSLGNYTDCLYLLDGRFHQLHTLHVNIATFSSHLEIDNRAAEGQCLIYSSPYTLKEYNMITNNFQGGLFECVREISLFDEQPFEHEFFLLIAQSFLLIKKLTLNNQKPRKNKQYTKSKDDEQDFSIIKYSHLIYLNLYEAHEDYIELFLDHTKTYLPSNMDLAIDYELLKKAT